MMNKIITTVYIGYCFGFIPLMKNADDTAPELSRLLNKSLFFVFKSKIPS